MSDVTGIKKKLENAGIAYNKNLQDQLTSLMLSIRSMKNESDSKIIKIIEDALERLLEAEITINAPYRLCDSLLESQEYRASSNHDNDRRNLEESISELIKMHKNPCYKPKIGCVYAALNVLKRPTGAAPQYSEVSSGISPNQTTLVLVVNKSLMKESTFCSTDSLQLYRRLGRECIHPYQEILLLLEDILKYSTTDIKKYLFGEELFVRDQPQTSGGYIEVQIPIPRIKISPESGRAINSMRTVTSDSTGRYRSQDIQIPDSYDIFSDWINGSGKPFYTSSEYSYQGSSH